jgi:hypothetical protein
MGTIFFSRLQSLSATDQRFIYAKRLLMGFYSNMRIIGKIVTGSWFVDGTTLTIGRKYPQNLITAMLITRKM